MPYCQNCSKPYCTCYQPYTQVTNCTPVTTCNTGCLTKNTTDCVYLKTSMTKCDNTAFPKDTTTIQEVLDYLMLQNCNNNTNTWTIVRENVVIGSLAHDIHNDSYMTQVVGNELKCYKNNRNQLHLKGVVKINYNSDYITTQNNDEIISSDTMLSPEIRGFYTACATPTVAKYFKVMYKHPVYTTDGSTNQVEYRTGHVVMKLKTNGEIVVNGTMYSNFSQNKVEFKTAPALLTLSGELYFDDIIINLD